MIFHIYSDRFKRVGEYSKSRETIPLKTLETKRNFFLPLKSEKILSCVDTDMDFDEFTKDMSEEEKEACFYAVQLLYAFSAAELTEEEKDPSVPETRVCGERDYKELAAFFKERDPDYGYDQDSLRAWQFNNSGYSFLCRQNGRIIGAASFEMPTENSFSATIVLTQLAFEGSDQEECGSILKMLIKKAADSFGDEYIRMRYLFKAGSDEEILSLLKKQGFELAGSLEKESLKGEDIDIYDRMF